MLSLGSMFRKHGLSFHCYADNTQIYLPLKQSSNGLEALMSDVKAWLLLNFLNFNESKTEIIVFGPSDSRSTPKVNLGDLTSSVKPWVKKSGCHFWWWFKIWQTDKYGGQVLLFSASTSSKSKTYFV